jgi:hypothetical protein
MIPLAIPEIFAHYCDPASIFELLQLFGWEFAWIDFQGMIWSPSHRDQAGAVDLCLGNGRASSKKGRTRAIKKKKSEGKVKKAIEGTLKRKEREGKIKEGKSTFYLDVSPLLGNYGDPPSYSINLQSSSGSNARPHVHLPFS